MTRTFFSIVIPVYNVEPYIARCLDSCINQTFRDIEIIIVDDCGSDNSIKIAEEYAKKDSRITIIHNSKNLGLFHTRRIGEQEAKGQYIIALDSDDYLRLEACKTLFDYLQENQTDILHFGVSYKNSSQFSLHALLHYCRYILPENKKSILYSQTEIIKHFFITPYHFPRFAMWGKVFSRELLIKAWKLFPKDQIEHIIYAEDALFLFFISLVANSYQTIPDRLYIYIYINICHAKQKFYPKKTSRYPSITKLSQNALSNTYRKQSKSLYEINQHYESTILYPTTLQRKLSPKLQTISQVLEALYYLYISFNLLLVIWTNQTLIQSITCKNHFQNKSLYINKGSHARV